MGGVWRRRFGQSASFTPVKFVSTGHAIRCGGQIGKLMRLLFRFFGFLFAAGTIVFLVVVGAAAGLLWGYGVAYLIAIVWVSLATRKQPGLS